MSKKEKKKKISTGREVIRGEAKSPVAAQDGASGNTFTARDKTEEKEKPCIGWDHREED